VKIISIFKFLQKNIYDYWKYYDLTPINLPNNKCIIYNIKTKEKNKFDRQLKLCYNFYSDDYFYNLTNGKNIKILKFESTKKQLKYNNKLLFGVEYKDKKIYLNASNNFEIIKNALTMYNIINDAIQNNRKLIFSHEKKSETLDIVIEINNPYFEYVLKFSLEKKCMMN